MTEINLKVLQEILDANSKSAITTTPSSASIRSERVRSKTLENDRLQDDNANRNILVQWMMVVVSLWLLITGAIVKIQFDRCGMLSNSVLCTFLTTTTANVLGLAIIVLKDLFPKKQT